MTTYHLYSLHSYEQHHTPLAHITTPLASFNHVACSHDPYFSDLPIRVMQRCEASGTKSVVLRGCISFNPAYREHSSYTPHKYPHARTSATALWRTSTPLLFRYEQYLLWLSSFIGEFPIIKYVELFNEYHYCGANYLTHNKILMNHIIRYFHKVIKPNTRRVRWGISEPLIGAIDSLKHLDNVNRWRISNKLDYTGIQVHMRREIMLLDNLPKGSFAVTENYTSEQINQPSLLYQCYG